MGAELWRDFLGCLEDINSRLPPHQQIDSVAVLVNIFAPTSLRFTGIDSAYLRIIAGGHTTMHRGNFVINNAEGVRGYPRFTSNGLLLGMF